MNLFKITKFLRFVGKSNIATINNTGSLLLTLCSTYDSYFIKTPVHTVTLPGKEGDFTISYNHSPTIIQLSSGPIIVRRNLSENPHSFFISDGFLLYKRHNENFIAEVIGIEIFPLEYFDKSCVNTLIKDIEKQSRSTPWEITKFHLG
ncbi:ATP synthase delta subunit, putative [Cryptosporidium muris RN66]|uniref:ATP synthase delta subunit, putative n=1 Tax=Cryptosporidium muris (strain RN66) TaxID=441375 RepID=B6ADW3_CRYMR|nr:ATP synthase delta subunit, putative [Cryptosporidium muris RN66]EEA06404.1 ATP synthase delta subunit, putative [Cryptosporidium muris RN66]|eukprot:XP_002140753.1 ATP synthase delta subunit [Cryptosporidium muris RN66]